MVAPLKTQTPLFAAITRKAISYPLVDGVVHYQSLSDDAPCATFKLTLPAGKIRLHTWFDDDDLQPICGAYYVYVNRETGSTRPHA